MPKASRTMPYHTLAAIAAPTANNHGLAGGKGTLTPVRARRDGPMAAKISAAIVKLASSTCVIGGWKAGWWNTCTRAICVHLDHAGEHARTERTPTIQVLQVLSHGTSRRERNMSSVSTMGMNTTNTAS